MADSVKDMTTKFGKLDKFEGSDFRRWQKKMHFLLTTLKVAYVLSTPRPEFVEEETLEQTRKRCKWDNDDYICRGHILNGMSDALFDVYQNVESAKELWDQLEAKYMAEDTSSKKFLVSNFNNYRMVDSRSVMEQYHELLRILGQYTQHGLFMDEAISVSSIIDKLPPSWKDFKHMLKHNKDELSLVQLGSHFRIEETLRMEESGKGKGKDIVGSSSVNMVEDDKNKKNNKNSKGKKRKFHDKKDDSNKRSKMTCWKCGKPGHFKKDCRVKKNNGVSTSGSGQGSKDPSPQQGLISNHVIIPVKNYVSHIYEICYVHDNEIDWWIDSGATCHACKDHCWFDTFHLVEDGSVLHMANESTKPILGRGNVVIEFSSGKQLLYLMLCMFYVIEPNGSISVNSVIESRDAIFDENRFSLIPRPKDIVSSSNGTQGEDLPVEGSRDEIASQYSYCYSIEEDPKTFDEAMKSQDIAFWKEAVDDEIGSIMENNTWVLSDLPPGCKPLGCKWIFKRKIKVDGTIIKFKARLVIQGFRQKEGSDYFDTYAPVAHISTIRLLIALAATHNLVIHQMDVKTSFLNGDLEEEIYYDATEGFSPKQWHHKFDEVVLSNGFVLNQSDKCVYCKFDESGKGVIICLYVDDMLIFGTNQTQVDKTKEFLSSNFSMKDMGEADVILGIRIKRENKGLTITQSHYIEKISKKFNCEGCGPVSTPMEAGIKLMPHVGKPVNQLEYSRAIGCLMYAMTSTRPDIAYAVGKLSRFTSNPSNHHWEAITRVFSEDHTSTTGWVFLLGGGAISWASKKQTCITDSTMESEFVALAAAGKEAEWLRNLIYEIPLWPKPIILTYFPYSVIVLHMAEALVKFTWKSDT
ncbi:zinc finger, CCHC-type containing protein [Tanacetum coccineum]